MWCWLSLKIIDFIQSFSSILETFLPHLLVHCHPFRFQNETWENRSWTLGTWSAQPAGLLPKAGGEGQPVSGAFPPESHTPVSPQGVATSCQCAWGREEGKGCGPRGESGDLHSSSAPARPCSGPAVPSSEAPWLWFSKESILCQGKGGSAGRAGDSGRRAVIGNKQCAFYYLNPRYQASAMVRAKWPQCWVASFSPLLLVNNHLFFFFSLEDSLKFLLFYYLGLQFSLSCLYSPLHLQASLIVILAEFLEGKEIKMHGQFIIWPRNLGKLHKLHKGNLPHIVLPCALKLAAPLFCWWKGKHRLNFTWIRNSVLPFWSLNIGPNCFKKNK